MRFFPHVFWLSDDDRTYDLHDLYAKLPRRSGLIVRSRGPLAPVKKTMMAARPWRYQHSVFVTGKPDIHAHGLHVREGERMGPPLCRLAQRFWLTTSCHSVPALIKQNKSAIHAIMISPVFPTQSHPNQRPLGLYQMRKMLRLSKKPVIVLGGINNKTLRLIPKNIRWAGVSFIGDR